MNLNNQDELAIWIQGLIDRDEVYKFYECKEWRRLRKVVLEDYKYECQICKANGKYTKANHVHHNQFVRHHPRLALTRKYIFKGKEYVNLLPVCKECHETVCHPKRLKHDKEIINEERW